MGTNQGDYFRQLFDANSRKVFNIALNLVQSIEDAEDITQDVFIEVHRSLPQFEEKSDVSTWIYRIAVNKSLDFLRSKKRKKRFAFFTTLFHSESGEPLHEVSHFEHPGAMLENKEQTKILMSAVDSLPENQKTAFVLSKIEGLPQKQIALIMRLSGKAVEALLQRAKWNLKKSLEIYFDERGI